VTLAGVTLALLGIICLNVSCRKAESLESQVVIFLSPIIKGEKYMSPGGISFIHR